MRFKTDWPETRNWLAGWWRREVRGHWALGVTAPRRTPLAAPPAPPTPTDLRTRWLDADGHVDRSLAQMAQRWYGGVAFPHVALSLGPGMLNLFLGSEPTFMPETVWYNPAFRDPAKTCLRLDPENFYWRWTLESLRRCRAKTAGQCLTVVPDLIEGLDILSELFGTEELLVYLLDCPQEIHRLLDELDDLYFQAFDPIRDLVQDEIGGNAYIAFNCWGPSRTLKTQCDFSAMISPDMFAEFVVPHLDRQCARVDFSAYHLDGPNAVRHLPQLLRVPSLNAIQWTPGAGQPEAAHRGWWDSIWRPVFAAGKSAMVLGTTPPLIEPSIKEFGQAGTLMVTGAESEDDGKALLDRSANWGA